MIAATEAEFETIKTNSPEVLYSVGLVKADLFWWSDVEINEHRPMRPVVLAGQCLRLFRPVAFQRIIIIDPKNERYLVQAKCGGGNWFAWVPFDCVEHKT